MTDNVRLYWIAFIWIYMEGHLIKSIFKKFGDKNLHFIPPWDFFILADNIGRFPIEIETQIS